MSKRTWPQVLSEKREYLAWARAHRAHPPADCTCHLCMSTAEFDALIRARLTAQEARNGPPPF